jgi:prepilin-type N-terminal cleavage/methylation domain-containing protein
MLYNERSMWAKNKQNNGFTIVELLIVIVVIGILAAITIVAYNGVQNKAHASSASSALTQAVKKIGVWQVDNPGTTPTDLSTAGVADGTSVSFQYKPGVSGAYCITATSGTVSYKITEATQPEPGACTGHGSGGVAAVTNLVVNPQGTSFITTANIFRLNSGRWFGSGGSGANASNVSGATPVGNTFARKTWSVAPTAGGGGDTGFDAGGMNVTEGEVFSLSAYLRPSKAKASEIGVYLYDAAGVNTSRPRSPAVVIPANAWTRVSWTYTIPSGVTRIGVAFDITASTSGGAVAWAVGDTLDITGMMVTKTNSVTGYGDGGTAGWDWTGTANSSTSSGPPS